MVDKIIRKKRIIIGILSIFMFITLFEFVVLLTIYILSIVNIGYVFIPLFFLLLEVIAQFVLFSQLTNIFPINPLSDDAYKEIKSQCLKDKTATLHISQGENGKWYIDNNLYFDMKGYFFPKIYICSFFIRNIHYPIINKNKFKLGKLFKSLKTNEYDNLFIEFHYKNRTKVCTVVRKGKTKLFPLRGLIILSRFYLDVLKLYNKGIMCYVPVNEKYYNSLKKDKGMHCP